MLKQMPRPVIFAHRGAKAHAPENTLASFELAAQCGAPAIELDVKLTADKEVVVLHDSTLDRTTNGHGRLVDHSLAQIRELDAGSHFSPDFRDERIPTLSEVFEAVGRKVFINVELTNYETAGDDLVPRVVALVRSHSMQDNVLFSSFNPFNLIKARRLIPEVPVGLLALEGRAGWWMRALGSRIIPHDALHPYTADVDAQLVDRVHRGGHRIHVWTVNQPEDMRRLFHLGVDGIFTDDPALALQILREQV